MEATCVIEEASLEDETEPLAELRAKTDRELAEYVRDKLNLALSLACQAEEARRAGRRTAAAEYQRRWKETIAEVSRLLPLVGKDDKTPLVTKKSKTPRLPPKPRE
jgi:hypothetical protein